MQYPLNAKAAVSLSGLWWNPNESGWGVTFDHQESFIFATFFIYGLDGKPYWVVSQLDAASPSQTSFSGTVFATSGTPFSKSPFIAGDTKVSTVGTSTLAVVDSNHATLAYTVNNVPVVKQIQRQTNKPIVIAGTYDGGTDSHTLAFAGSSLTMTIGEGAGSSCILKGTPVQYGSRFVAGGLYRCSDFLNGFTDGTWSTDDLTIIDQQYISGTIYKLPTGASQYISKKLLGTNGGGGSSLIPGSTPELQSSVSLTGLWWNPSESGWGVTLDHQSDFIFATFFIYDSNGRPYWVVSQLDGISTAPATFTGNVYATTGTAFSISPFIAGDTKVTTVGTATLSKVDSNHATLAYTVNGLRIEKTIQRQTNKAISLSGNYSGGVSPGVFGVDPHTVKITANGNSIAIQTTTFAGASCNYVGTPSQFGARFSIRGTYQCSDFRDGTWATDDMLLLDGSFLIATVVARGTGATQSYPSKWFVTK